MITSYLFMQAPVIAAEDTSLAVVVVEFRAEDAMHALAGPVQRSRKVHAEQRRGEVDPQRGRSRAPKADPNVRAGFTLIPEVGASPVMNGHPKAPAR
jgi:hypothetical protein